MALQDKYAELLQTATTLGVANLAVAEKDGVLHVSGTANSTVDYDALWALYDKIDPNMASGDLMMNVDIKADAGAQLKVTTDSTNLNIRSTPSTDKPDSKSLGASGIYQPRPQILHRTSRLNWSHKRKTGESGWHGERNPAVHKFFPHSC